MKEHYEIVPVANGFILRPSHIDRAALVDSGKQFYVFSDSVKLGEFIANNFEVLGGEENE